MCPVIRMGGCVVTRTKGSAQYIRGVCIVELIQVTLLRTYQEMAQVKMPQS